MTTTVKHTPGAMRAAEAVLIEDALRPLTVHELAEIIDRETGAGEMLKALERSISVIQELLNFDSHIDSRIDWQQKREFAFASLGEFEATIRKARGE